MKKLLAVVSMLLMIVAIPTKVDAYVLNDGGGYDETVINKVAPIVVALNPTAIDNVEVVSSVENVVASVMNCTEVGGSIISSDAADPDDSNFVTNFNDNELFTDNAIVTKIYNLNRMTFGGERVKLRRNIKIANNDNDKVGNITANVGKSLETYII